jgi:uncharacterized protein with HEPN domain
MSLERRDAAYIWDMLEAAEAVRRYIAGYDLVRYEQDRQVRSAVERELEIIGEAARRLSPEFRAAHPDLPWTSIVAQRNMLAHEYQRIENARIWKVASDLLPRLEQLLRSVLPPLPEQPAE